MYRIYMPIQFLKIVATIRTDFTFVFYKLFNFSGSQLSSGVSLSHVKTARLKNNIIAKLLVTKVALNSCEVIITKLKLLKDRCPFNSQKHQRTSLNKSSKHLF